MRKECQRINNCHSFLTVMINYHKSPVIDQSLDPQPLTNNYSSSHRSDEDLMSNFFLTSEAENLNPP